MATEKQYYKPQIVDVPIPDRTELVRLKEEEEAARKAAETASSEFQKWRLGFLETSEKQSKTSVLPCNDLSALSNVFQNAKKDSSFDVEKGLRELIYKLEGDLALDLNNYDRTWETFFDQRLEEKIKSAPPNDKGCASNDLVFESASQRKENVKNFLTFLRTIKDNYSNKVKELNAVKDLAVQASERVYAVPREYIKNILDNEAKKAIKEVCKKTIGNKPVSKISYSSSYSRSPLDVFLGKIERNGDKQEALKTLIETNDFKGNEGKRIGDEIIENLKLIVEAYEKDINNIPNVIQKAEENSQRGAAKNAEIVPNNLREFLSQYQPYKDLISRIGIIEARIKDGSSFQDKTKNELKVKTLKELNSLVENKNTSSEELKDFLTNSVNQETIKQSTRSDEGCFGFFFRNEPESKALFEKILEDIDKKKTVAPQNESDNDNDNQGTTLKQ